MNAPKIVGELAAELEKRGRAYSHGAMATLLRVTQPTVSRWARGDSQPRGHAAESLHAIHQALVANPDHPVSQRIVDSVLGEGSDRILLGLGLEGVLRAAGLGWLIVGG